jgi:Ankyrin repeats (3 copies)
LSTISGQQRATTYLSVPVDPCDRLTPGPRPHHLAYARHDPAIDADAVLTAARPGLITWAAACGRPAAVEILAGLGFDVNARGRTDVPSDQPWQTALHKAAEDGNVELARILLRLGADPGIRDRRFNSTPLGWARYFGQEEIIELLEPLTPPEPDHHDVS